LFPEALIRQEISAEREIEIPEPVRAILRQWRPTPLVPGAAARAGARHPGADLLQVRGREPGGSHKPNTAVAAGLLQQAGGHQALSTETGAGQWGSSLAMACNFFGMECQVFMVKVSYNQKPYRRALMETFGATVTASPSETACGREILARDPACTGSLGIAISEAVEVAASRADTNYALGSVLNHVLLHQTVIGIESRAQMEQAGDYPDVIVGCTGGGSNFAGIAFPFIGEAARRPPPERGRGRTRRLPEPHQGALRL
jgi:tryptophan synthase beta chain